MYLKFKKLHSSAVIPSYAKAGDAGLDLVATTLDKSNKLYSEYGTGLAIEMPPGCVGLLFPRSSISKTSHTLRNSVGVIDSGYRGEIRLRMSSQNLKSDYRAGDRVGQLIIFEIPHLKIVEEEDLSISARGKGGFGSTGA